MRFRILLICLISILGIFLVFSGMNLKEKLGVSNYPQEVPGWQRLLANVSQVFRLGSQKVVEVYLKQQEMRILENGEAVETFSVSSGKKNTPTPTPTGNFRVYTKSVMVYSNLANCWLPFWVGFTSDGLYGFHELPICQKGRKGIEEIGEPASIGCIRLNLNDSEIFYKWVEIGTPVKIYIDKPQEIDKTQKKEEIKENSETLKNDQQPNWFLEIKNKLKQWFLYVFT